MKKVLTILSLLFVIFAIFTGCGNDEEAQSSSTQPITTLPSIPNLDDNFICEEHVFGEWQQVSAPTCTEDGLMQCVCSVCFQQLVAGVPKTGHVPLTEDGYLAPTCKKEGKTARTVCSECSKVLEESEPIPKINCEYDQYGYCIYCSTQDPFYSLRMVIFTKPNNSVSYLTSVLDAQAFDYTISYVTNDTPDTLSGYDIYVYYLVSPNTLPTDGAVWLINPPSLPEDYGKLSADRYVAEQDSEAVLLTDNEIAKIITNKITINSPKLYANNFALFDSLSEKLFPVITQNDKPLLVAGIVNNLPVALFSFDISSSTLPLLVSAYPILIRNLLRYSFDNLKGIEHPSCTHERVNIEAKEPTCVDYGLSKGIKCAKCGKILVPQEIIKPTNKHDLDEMGNCKNCSYFLKPVKSGDSITFIIDVSLSMNEAMGEKSRLDVIIEAISSLILDESEQYALDSTTFINVICFDQDSYNVLEFTQLDFNLERQNIVNAITNGIYHSHYAYYLDEEGNETEIPYCLNDPDSKTVKISIEGEDKEITVYAPSLSSKDNYDSTSNQYIKSYGTSYSTAILKAINNLSTLKEAAEINNSTMIFISDGKPNDLGAGYDGYVKRLASQGVIFSTIMLGNYDRTAVQELTNLSALGMGGFQFLQNENDLLSSIRELIDLIS